MTEMRKKNFDRTNAVVAGIVFLGSLLVYARTVAPTLSFWDCGEFIAASYLLAIPHPPGTPLYVLIGRIFSIIPFASDIAVRVNLVSAFCSAGTALFGYLVAVRLLRQVLTDQHGLIGRVYPYAGAAAGAFFLAFSLTNWNNSVEAEVYGMAMCLFMAIVWLGLQYMEQPGTPRAARIAVLVFFLASLGIGVHMLVFAALPLFGLHFSLRKDAPRYVWHAIAIFVGLVLYLMFALSSRPGEVSYYVPIVIVGIVYLFYIFSYQAIPLGKLLIAAGFALSCAPLFALGIVGLTGNASPGLMNTAHITGYVVFSALVAWSAYGLMHGYKRYGSFLRSELIHWYFVGAALVMTLLLQFPKGYTSFLFLTAILAVILFAIIRKYLNWPVLIALIAISTIILGVKQFAAGALIGLVVVVLLGLGLKMRGWRTAAAAIVLSIIGFSVHFYLPIRAAEDPAINESDPSESMYMFVGFIERKQYGSESMIERIFERRASWEHQFGDFRRIGFWRLLEQQYGLRGAGFTLLLIIGLFGLWELVRRNARIGWTMIILILLTSVGLVLYMNFADGTRMDPITGEDYLEVRDRDYFYTPVYLLFALAIGVGTGVTALFLKESATRISKPGAKAIVGASVILFLLPAFALAENYKQVDRTENYLAYDYGFNLLSSCESNGILFTGGDNDTFPLWCLQLVYGYRRDVTVVNLSLANTHWYMQQIRDFTPVNLPLTDEQTRGLRNIRLQDGRRLRVQDQVVDAIIDNNLDRAPIYFSTSTGSNTRNYHGRQADKHLILHGMVWQFVADTSTGSRVDVHATLDILRDSTRFKTRGVSDPDIHKDEAAAYLVQNYGNVYIIVADSLRAAGEYDQASRVINTAYHLLPRDPAIINFKASLLADQLQLDDLHAFIDTVQGGEMLWLRTIEARAFMKAGDRNDQAEALLRKILADDPTFKPAFETLSGLYYTADQPEKLRALMREWLQANPNDNAVRNILTQMEHSLRQNNNR